MNILAAITLLTLALVAIACLQGCAPAKHDTLAGIGNAAGTIEGRQHGIKATTDTIEGHKPQKSIIHKLADESIDQSKSIETAAQTAAVERDTWRRMYETLRDAWWTRYGGQTIKVWVYWIAGIWTGLGVLAVVTGNISSLAWVSKEIVRSAPLMNPFSWIRDAIARRRAARAEG